jgi:hypothetical protein
VSLYADPDESDMWILDDVGRLVLVHDRDGWQRWHRHGRGLIDLTVLDDDSTGGTVRVATSLMMFESPDRGDGEPEHALFRTVVVGHPESHPPRQFADIMSRTVEEARRAHREQVDLVLDRIAEAAGRRY